MNNTKLSLQESIYQHLTYSLAKRGEESKGRDLFRWTRKAFMNVARMRKFSSDRTIYGYARNGAWKYHRESPSGGNGHANRGKEG